MRDLHLILAVAIMSLVTIALRFLPFIFLQGRETPQWIRRLNEGLPFAVMGMLVVYCLRDMKFSSVGGFLPQVISVAVVSISYIIKKNTLVSIVLGTALYMVLVTFVFV